MRSVKRHQSHCRCNLPRIHAQESHHKACTLMSIHAPSRDGPLHLLSATEISDRGGWIKNKSAQVAAANAALLERKAVEAAQQAAEEQRIAAYLADKAAREQVRLFCRVSPVFPAGLQLGMACRDVSSRMA